MNQNTKKSQGLEPFILIFNFMSYSPSLSFLKTKSKHGLNQQIQTSELQGFYPLRKHLVHFDCLWTFKFLKQKKLVFTKLSQIIFIWAKKYFLGAYLKSQLLCKVWILSTPHKCIEPQKLPHKRSILAFFLLGDHHQSSKFNQHLLLTCFLIHSSSISRFILVL